MPWQRAYYLQADIKQKTHSSVINVSSFLLHGTVGDSRIKSIPILQCALKQKAA